MRRALHTRPCATLVAPPPRSRDLRLTGFSVDAYLRSLTKAQRDAAVRGAVDLLRGGDKGKHEGGHVCHSHSTDALTCRPPLPAASKLKLLLAREPFADFSVALKRSLTKGERTVVLTMQ